MTIGGPPARPFGPARRAAVPPFYVMKVWAAAQRRLDAGLPVHNLAAGQPSTPAPAPVLAAAHRMLDEEILGYTEATGIAPLRRAIAGHYRRRYDLSVDPDSVVVTTGSSGAFLLAFLTAFDVGSRIGVPRPGYPAYRNLLHSLGCEVVDLPCGPQTRFQPTVEMVAEADLDGLVVASPANPTGTMLDGPELAALATHCARTGVRLISDEIYHGITYGGRTSCAWTTDRSGVVVNSFSKYFSMTGWRIGWLLAPDDLRESIDDLGGNLAICPPAPAQYAALAAFDGTSECDGHVVRYAENRRRLLRGLAELGIDRTAPADGAFYVYADIGHLLDETTPDSLAFTGRLLDEAGVAAAPGIDFDPVDGHRFVRFSFAGATATVDGALAALRAFLRR